MGDLLIDVAGGCFTIVSVDVLPAATRLRCATRNLSLVYELNDRVQVQQAIWEDTGGGPTITGWTTLRTALPARIQPERLEIDDTTTPPTATATFLIVLGEQLALTADSRFIDPQGNVYRLVEYTQTERIDALPVAIAVREPAS